MRNTKIVVLLLLCSMMIISCLSIQIFAAGNETNLVYNLSATEVNVGDTVTLTIGLKETKASSVIMGVSFDKELLTVTKRSANKLVWSGYDEEEEEDVEGAELSHNTLTSTKNANNTGYLGVVYVNVNTDVTYSAKSDVLTITFTAKAAGTVNFTFREDSDGPDGFKSDNAATTTLTIKEPAPACDHSTTKLVPNNDKTHNVVCAAEGCGHVVTENVTCTGTDDGDCTTAVTCACGNVVTAASGGHVAGEDDGSCTTAVKCVNCDQEAVAAKEHSFTNKASTTQKTPADCTNAATYYVQCDNCDAVSDTKTIEVGEAKGHGHTLGFRYTSDGVGTNTHTKYCNDCNQAIEGEKNIACADKTGDGNHACDANCGNTSVNGHTGGTAYCTQKAVCTECNTAYGEYDPTKHRATEYYPSEWKYNGDGTHSKTYTCGSCRQISSTDTEDCYDGADHGHDCDKCPSSTPRSECHGGKATCLAPALCSECSTYYGDKNPSNHASDEVTYEYVTATTHNEYHKCCDTLKEENVTHTYKGDEHKCICGAVQKYWFKVDYNGGVVVSSGNTTLGFGVQTDYNKTPNINGHSINPTREGYRLTGWNTKADGTGEVLNDFATFVMPDHDVTLYAQWECTHDSNYHDLTTTYTDNEGEKHTKVVTCDCDTIVSTETVEHNFNNAEHTCVCGAKFTGWEDKTYFVEAVMQTGWTKIDDAWYYLDPTTGYRAEGLTRVPYPAAPINGVTYARNEEDAAYYNAHKDTSKYSDFETAVFYFDANGKFVQYDGIVGNSYFIDGMAPWHVGMVKIGNDYYYFAGDKSDAKMGNVMATGKVYVTRVNNTGKANGVYNFADDGTLIGNYYGLFEQGHKIYYRRSNGELAKGKYYITTTNGMKGFTKGMKLYFDETTGEMLGIKNGIVEEGGVLYYYENNHLACSKGIVKMTDEQGETYYIYVRSNGQLATGKYWPTTGVITEENPDGLLPRGEYDWGTDGKYYPAK